jgi:lipopolysaccharide biosynthesis glycosyltransferase
LIYLNRFRTDIRVVHFAGALKPWQLTYNPQTQQLSGNLGGQHEVQREFLLSWWNILYERVWPQLSKHNQVG